MEVKNFDWNSLAGNFIKVVFLALILLFAYYTFGSPSSGSPAATGQEIFDAQCQSCHTIGGGNTVGPDLQGVLVRRDRDWVARFIASPDFVIAEGDPIAMELLEEFNGIEMPNRALTDEDVEFVLVFLEVQDSLTQAAEDLPTGNAAVGEKLFTGAKMLEGRGTPCMACHTVGSVGQFGGGNFGPDLTHVYGRYGEAGLTSAMQNISFPTMKNVYLGKALSAQGAADLLSFFDEAAILDGEDLAESSTNIFWGVGSAGALFLFIIMAFYWPRQSKNQTERLRNKADADSRRNS